MRGPRGYSDRTLAFAKKLRREPTDAEIRLWSRLRSRQLMGLKFRRQQPLGGYVADFVCQEQRLVIELDGGQHAVSAKESIRTEFIEGIGYTVLRFWNNDVLGNTDGVLITIARQLVSAPSPTTARRQAAKPSYPLPHGERG